MCFGSVSCRHLFHSPLESTHPIQPHQNSPTGQEVISGLLDIVCVCVCVCVSVCVCVCVCVLVAIPFLFMSKVLSIFHKPPLL